MELYPLYGSKYHMHHYHSKFTHLASVLAALILICNLAVATTPEAQLPSAIPSLSPLSVYANTTRNVVDALANRHYVNAALNDAMSSRIFENYLDALDPAKSYFLVADIKGFEYFRFELDNSLRRGDVSPAFTVFNLYQQRVVERFKKIIAELEQGIDHFDFTLEEELVLDREATHWARSSTELDELWRKRIKNAVLNLKLTKKTATSTQMLLAKRYKNRLSGVQQTNSEDVYQLYMNAFTKAYDPHTQYFSPRTSENFSINMSLSLEGIGAVLQREDEYTKVASLVSAGPAEKSKKIFPEDKIIAVGQGLDGNMIDVIGWRLDEVVQLIRGKKGTIVKLDIISPHSPDTTKTINLTRSKVKLEEQAAKANIIEVEQFGATYKIGVISIPAFYIDFAAQQAGDRNFKSTTRDVQKLLVELQQTGVAGIMIDLRNNGGGSLQEAAVLTGLFIDLGPTVQIRSKLNRVDILNDRDIRTIYGGPLAVLVNRLSASASEIFAGAIQDYERGLVIGSQTFGKGTVQSLLRLNRGQLKLTQAKFYRISGESTQHQGIIPDILFPNDFDPKTIGESALDAPLPWDQIQATSYRLKGAISPLLSHLRLLHQKRAAEDPEFVYTREALAYRQNQANIKLISLNEKRRLAKKEDMDNFWLALENQKRIAQGLTPVASLTDFNPTQPPLLAAQKTSSGAVPAAENSTAENSKNTKAANALIGNELAGLVNTDSSSVKISETSHEPISKTTSQAEESYAPDAYLLETSNILLDLISLTNRMAKKPRFQPG